MFSASMVKYHQNLKKFRKEKHFCLTYFFSYRTGFIAAGKPCHEKPKPKKKIERKKKKVFNLGLGFSGLVHDDRVKACPQNSLDLTS